MLITRKGAKLARAYVAMATEAEMQRLDLPHGAEKVIRFFIILQSVIKGGTLSADDLLFPKKYDGAAFPAVAPDVFDDMLAGWLSGEERFDMLDFLDFEIKIGKFHQSEFYRILHRMAEKIMDAYPTGYLDNEQLAAFAPHRDALLDCAWECS